MLSERFAIPWHGSRDGENELFTTTTSLWRRSSSLAGQWWSYRH
jgi:hypothetical protein